MIFLVINKCKSCQNNNLRKIKKIFCLKKLNIKSYYFRFPNRRELKIVVKTLFRPS